MKKKTAKKTTAKPKKKAPAKKKAAKPAKKTAKTAVKKTAVKKTAGVRRSAASTRAKAAVKKKPLKLKPLRGKAKARLTVKIRKPRHKDLILVLDFGSQYTQLIARRIRENKVFSRIVPFNITPEEIKKMNPKG